MPIPQYNMSVNDPSTQGEIEGTQELTKRRFVTFRGTTTGTTPGEIFLDGVANYRLKVHNTGVMNVRYNGVGLGTTAALSSGTSGEVTVGNFGGTTALIGAQVAAVRGVAAEAYTFTADDTNDALVLTVTGGTGTTGTKYWEVQCWVSEHSIDTGYPV